MKRGIIVHGMISEKRYHDPNLEDSQSNSHWIPWLQHQLCARDILTQTPEMPRPYDPEYSTWKDEIEKMLPDKDTLIVGHSCGGGVILRWLSENPDIIVGKVVLVAPWLDIEKDYPDLFDFSIDQRIFMQSRGGINILYSSNDMDPIKLSVSRLQENLPQASYHRFENYGHFLLKDMGTREFPELLDICLG